MRPVDALALKEIENEHEKRKIEMQRGWIGIVLGTGPEKSGNVATLTIVASFFMILISFAKIDFSSGFDQFFKILTTMLGPVGLALGYLFGSREPR